MAKYLIDVNLPYYFSLWRSDDFIHQKDIDDEWDDEQIWDYARKNNLAIISKDSDFSNKIMLHAPPPKVIHIRFGNMKMKLFFKTITKCWNEVVALEEKCKLINVFADRVEGVV